MSIVLLALVVLTVVAAAGGCYALLTPRVREGRVDYGRAAAVTLLVLLMTPAIATVLLLSVWPDPGVAAYGVTLYVYAGYAVGLVCFIVLNRHFRGIGS